MPGTTEVKINPETNTLLREGVETQINPFDLYALEEAVRTKEKMTEAGDQSTVTVISMGPPQAEDALREAISLGADDAILLSDRAFAGSDTWCTSYVLAMALKKLRRTWSSAECRQSTATPARSAPESRFTSNYGAGRLRRQGQIASTPRKWSRSGLSKRATRPSRSSCPCVLTVVKEINEPRTPSLRGKMAAKKAEIARWGTADIGARRTSAACSVRRLRSSRS